MQAVSRALLVGIAVLAAACSSPDTGGTAGKADVGKGVPDAALEVSFGKVPDGVGADLSDIELLNAQADADQATDETPDATADAPDAKKNGFNYECKPLTVESCVTECGSAGTRKCLKEWGPCIPPAEFCGNCADDDCNGLINEGCAPNSVCTAPQQQCPVALISVVEGAQAGTGTVLHLSAAGSYGQGTAKIAKWAWSVQAPLGAGGTFQPSADVQAPTYTVDVSGQYLFHLSVWDDQGVAGCVPALVAVSAAPSPPVKASVGCADGTREGFVDMNAYPQIAACAGAWDHPGITPDSVVATCGNQGGNSGPKASGSGCSSADLCAVGWHVCKGWQEVAQKSPTGCADATPADAKPKSLFFAIRQPSANGTVCGTWGDGFNDVFGCGNLGTTLAPDKNCGPLDRVLASTQPNSCGFNEAEPNLGPWECLGTGKSDLNEGANVTKKACQGGSCQYDGAPISAADKGGVLCCLGDK